MSEKIKNKFNNEIGKLSEDNVKEIAKLFPEVMTEEKIDFDKLKIVLGENVEDGVERYEFTWNGKRKMLQTINLPSKGTLLPDRKSSVNFDDTDNLYIEGDNLEVLKILRANYTNKIKMIYIDPPYNTGSDFIYKDDFKDSIKNYKEQTEQTMMKNAETSGRYHTDWLNMMYPRLRIARELLKEDGVIFISIDDREQANLKKVCDEIFGEENLLNTLIWYANPGGDKGDYIETTKQFVLVYAKEKKNTNDIELIEYLDDKEKKKYNLKDENGMYKQGHQLEKWGNDSTVYTHPNLVYSIYYNKEKNHVEVLYDYNLDEVENKKNSERELKYLEKNKDLLKKGYICYRPRETNAGDPGRWQISSNTFLERFRQNLYIFKDDKIYIKDYIIENKYKKIKDIDLIVDIKQKYDEELFVMFGKKVFNYPKTGDLLKKLILGVKTSNGIIMDFFSGSATTAHATMNLNSKDNGNRKFIMVQIPEIINRESTKEIDRNAYNFCVNELDEEAVITTIGKERIRRAAKKIYEENKDKDYIDEVDLGFKVLKLDNSNYKENIGLSVDVFVEGRSDEDILIELIIKSGIMLDVKYELIKTDNGEYYDVGSGTMIVCLNDITEELVDDIIANVDTEENPRIYFNDQKFNGHDSVKANVLHNLEVIGLTNVWSL